MWQDIAGIIAAVAFVVLVGFLALPLIKLGKVLDETTQTIKDLTEHTIPILDESAQVVSGANTQLETIGAITTAASEVTQNVSALTGLYAATLGKPLVKVAAFSYGVRQTFGKAAKRWKRDSGDA